MVENKRPSSLRFKTRGNWLLGAVPVLLLVLALVFLLPRSGRAAVELNVENGRALWYYHDCQENESSFDVAAWTVTPKEANDLRQVLIIDVDNGYPGYRLTCRLHLANSGPVPLRITSVAVKNSHADAVDVAASASSHHSDNILQPCGIMPSWGTEPLQVPAECQKGIDLTVSVLDGAEEGKRYGYTVAVGLSEVME